MQLTELELIERTKKVRSLHPTVHCITNIVTVNDCANVVHAVGASPIMAHHPMETAEVAANCDALVCNLGAIDDFEAMKQAVLAAKQAHHPIVIDPVGVGGISYRRAKCKELMQLAAPDCIRGNASEIRALVEDINTTIGVDVSEGEQEALLQVMAQTLAGSYDCIVVLSGATDIITDGQQCYFVEAGDPMMTRITGTGCMSSAMLGAFLGAESKARTDKPKEWLRAAAASCEYMGRCGQVAAEQTRELGAGTMTFRTKLIDQLSYLDFPRGT